MFLVNSRSHLFVATSFCSSRRAFTYQRHTFSRSYGVILPSSFTRVLSSALGFSPRPPVSVWGTVAYNISLEAFPGSMASITSHRNVLVITPQNMHFRIFLEMLPTRLNRDIQHPADLAFSVPPSLLYTVQEY